MGLFDHPLKEKKTTRPSPAQPPMELRPLKISDLPVLADIERLSYQRLKKGQDGKFLSPMVTEPVIDGDFDIEVVPPFLLGLAGLQKAQKSLGRRVRMNVLGQGDKVLGGMMYEVNNDTNIVDLALLIIHPDVPEAAFKKVFSWFESIASHSLREFSIVYDLPDALDTPMQRVFTYLRDNGWSWKLKRNVYCGIVDAWQFKRTIGDNKPPKRLRKVA